MDNYAKACRLIGLHPGAKVIYHEVFAYKAMVWASENIADFYILFDDFENHWRSGGIFPGEYTGNTIEECMSLLIINYIEWIDRKE